MADVTEIQRMAERLGLYHMSKPEFGLKEEKIPNLDYLELVLAKELEMRESKKRYALIKASRLPEGQDLSEFDTVFQKGISKGHIEKLCNLEWITDKYNLLIMGNAGTGKTHLAAGLGYKAAEQGHKVFYTTLDELLFLMKTKESIGKSRVRLNYLKECRLIILDEIGYLPLTAEDARTLYSFIDGYNKKVSMIIVTNREFEKWNEIFHDEVAAVTLLDRITEKCQVIKLTGESYRLSNHKNIYRR